MVDRLMDVMLHCGAESISVICNSQMPEVYQHLLAYRDCRNYTEFHAQPCTSVCCHS